MKNSVVTQIKEEIMCQNCSLTFATKSLLSIHVSFCKRNARSQKHDKKTLLEQEKDKLKPFHCIIENCKSQFTRQTAMESHVKEIHGQKDYQQYNGKAYKSF